ncbi:MAG: phage tail protein, partial [Wolbachia sp.]
MTEQFLHGVNVIEVTSGAKTVRAAKSSVIGVIGTAPEADEQKFPLNKPVLIAGSLKEAAKLGKTGTLPQAVSSIFTQVGATVVVIRVKESEN